MMKQLLSLLMLAGIATTGFGQTKLISHKSHSGSMATFSLAVEKDLFDIGESNFGNPPSRIVRKFTIDSVIYLGDDKAVLISSEKDVEEYLMYNGKARPNRDSLVFKPGRDTVVNHPMFSKKHSLDSIKREVMMDERMRPVFVGYDNDKRAGFIERAQKKEQEAKKKKEEEKGAILPFINDNDSGFPPKGLLVIGLALLSGMVSLISWSLTKRAAVQTV